MQQLSDFDDEDRLSLTFPQSSGQSLADGKRDFERVFSLDQISV